MKRLGIITLMISLITCMTACGQTADVNSLSSTESESMRQQDTMENESLQQMENTMQNLEDTLEENFYIHIGNAVLTVVPADNSSAEEFYGLLQMGDITVEMSDYDNFEKVGKLPQSIVRNDESITTEPGDVILYQGNSITIYYDTNTWNFTRLGKISGVTQSELKEILGNGDVTVTFSLK